MEMEKHRFKPNISHYHLQIILSAHCILYNMYMLVLITKPKKFNFKFYGDKKKKIYAKYATLSLIDILSTTLNIVKHIYAGFNN